MAFMLTDARQRDVLCHLLVGFVLWRSVHGPGSLATSDLLQEARRFLNDPQVLAYASDGLPDVRGCSLCDAVAPYETTGAILYRDGELLFLCPACALAYDCAGYSNYAPTPAYVPGWYYRLGCSTAARREVLP
jgi:hypothetical protein